MNSQSTAATDAGVEFLSGDRPWVAIAANPYSGSGPTRRRVADLATTLGDLGLEPCVVWDRAERARLLGDPRLPAGCRCVVAAGGDGTVSDVINELGSAVPLATLPSGNENLFAREFGFRRDGRLLARAIAAGRTRQIDLGRARDRLFSLMLSVGFDSAVMHRVVAWRTMGRGLKRVNRLSYAKPIVDLLRSYRYPPLELEADGVRVRGTHAFVFNLPQYGFQIPFATAARADDGLLDWLVFERGGLGAMIEYMVSVVRQTHRARGDVKSGRARRVRIWSAEPMPVQMDGEAAGMTPVEIEAMPLALRVVQ